MKKIDFKNMSTSELEAQVRKHNRFYFIENKPIISDYEFDQLVEELRKRAPNSQVLTELVSDAAPERAKVKHEIPMLSLDKCYNEKTITAWADKFKQEVIASPKIDGVAVSIKYGNNGKIAQAATRGNGLEGEDITDNIKHLKDIPHSLNLKNIEVRGEVFMRLSVFTKYIDQFSNPRNLAAGAIKQKDSKKTGEYNLSFFAYDLLNTNLETEVEKREILEKNKIPTAPWILIPKDKMQRTFEELLAIREQDDFETDGVVYKANLVSEQERLGSTAHHPRFAIAYKFQGDSGVTTLKEVEWSVARTGVITPVAIVEPVELSGAMISRANLHNIGILKNLNLSIGAKVLMMRRGGVIPNLESLVEKGQKSVQIPKHCPSCSGPTEQRDDFLYCKQPESCVKSKIAELEHFIKEIDCDGFGQKLISKLYETGLVTDPAEFYTLTKDDLLQLERMGDKLASKLIANIEAKKELPLDVFLRSLGIRELGKHVSQILGEYGNLEKVLVLKEEELAAIHSIGDVIANHVVQGLKQKTPLIKKLLQHITLVTPTAIKTGPLVGKKFLFTGTLEAMERKSAQDIVEKNGGRIASSVSKDLDYLVVGAKGKPGSKLEKAKKSANQGGKTKIISEEEFLELIEK